MRMSSLQINELNTYDLCIFYIYATGRNCLLKKVCCSYKISMTEKLKDEKNSIKITIRKPSLFLCVKQTKSLPNFPATKLVYGFGCMNFKEHWGEISGHYSA